MNLQTNKVLITDILNCDSCKNIEICKIHQCLGNRTIKIIVADSDCSDTIRTIMLCKHFVDNGAPVLHIKSTPEDFEHIKKLLNEGTGIEYLQNQPECVMKQEDRSTCSLPDCCECTAANKRPYEEPCRSCNGQSLFVKRS